MCNPQQHEQQQQQEQQQNVAATSSTTPTAAYALYLHREELRRRKAHSARASATKIQLTSELIARTKQNIRVCSFEDLEILARETIFKKSLQRHLHYRRMQLQAWLLARKQGKILKQESKRSN
ncbi:uncharacterized protein LOC115766989 [Drosophila novamexicana]|uniref:uncharacterized protein LOC115766989 n=1 Tax=Drosophila novamexicana TaxID=47314 RepID=UPI0011E5A187|nr:uncharacterized protein LOC115766989 [Drosophila novamexicana]